MERMELGRLTRLGWLIAAVALPLVLSARVLGMGLPPVELQARIGGAAEGAAPGAEIITGRRKAILLVDRSQSMLMKETAPKGSSFSGQAHRWKLVQESLLRTLDELFAASPGIEVEIRKFGSELHRDIFRRTLGSKSDLTAIKAYVTSWGEPGDGSTALYASLATSLEAVLAEGRSQRFEWLFFGLYADGGDSRGEDTSADGRFGWRRLVRELRDIAAHQVVVIPVGDEARKLAGREFGEWQQATIADSIPKPPPPACRVELRAAEGWRPIAPLGELVRSGTVFTVPVHVTPVGSSAACDAITLDRSLRVRVSLEGDGGAFTLVGSSDLGLSGGSIAVRSTRDLDDGGAFSVRFTLAAADPSDTSMTLVGTAAATFGFRPAKFPPTPDRWIVSAPSSVRIGASLDLAVALDPTFRPRWTFADDGTTADGASVTHCFQKAGACAITLTATSPDEKSVSRTIATEVVDGSIQVVGPLEAEVAEEFIVQAKRVGPSDLASLAWRVNGAALPGGETLTFKSSSPGTYRIVCEATTKLGGYVFSDAREVVVRPKPRIAIASPNEIREGASKVVVQCLAEEVTAPLLLSVGGRTFRQAPIFGGESKVAIVQFELSAADVPADAELVLTAEGTSLRDARRLPFLCVEGLRAELASPPVESTVPFGEDTTLEFRPSASDGGDAGLIEAIDVEVVDVKNVRVGSGRATREGGWKIAIRPEVGRHAAALEVRTRVIGARLSDRCRREMVRVCGLRASMRETVYSIASSDGGELVVDAFASLPLRLDGARQEDRVSWFLDGRAFGGEATNPATPPLAAGSYAIRANLVRPDGAKKVVDATLVVRSTLGLSPATGSRHVWSGRSPPPIAVAVSGSAAELAQIETVEWIDATPSAGDMRSASIALPLRSDRIEPRSVQAVVGFRAVEGSSPPSIKLVAAYEIAPEPVKIARAGMTVGGRTAQGVPGGAVAYDINVEGAWQERKLTYSYQPDERASSLGRQPVQRTPLPAEPLVIDDEDDGVWTLHIDLVPYGGGAPQSVTLTYENLRRPDWVRASAIWLLTGFLCLLLIRIGTLNAGLWHRACLGLTRNEAETQGLSVRLRIFRRPRWGLIRKQARVPLAPILQYAIETEAAFQWLKDALTKYKGVAVSWRPSGKPTIDGLPAEADVDSWAADQSTLSGLVRYRPRPDTVYAAPQSDLWFGYHRDDSRSAATLWACCLLLAAVVAFAGFWLGYRIL